MGRRAGFLYVPIRVVVYYESIKRELKSDKSDKKKGFSEKEKKKIMKKKKHLPFWERVSEEHVTCSTNVLRAIGSDGKHSHEHRKCVSRAEPTC